MLGPGHAEPHAHELSDDADLQLGVGNVLALSARSILGRSCLVARVFAFDDSGLLEVGVSGDRMVRPHDVSIRDQAALAASLMSESIGRPAGFRVAAVAGRIHGRVVALLEVVAPGATLQPHADELHWLATAAALAMDDMAGGYVEALSDGARDLVRMAELTPREQQVLGLLGEGASPARIAQRLGISRNTVRTHIQNVRSKLGVRSSLEAVALSMRSGVAGYLDERPGA